MLASQQVGSFGVSGFLRRQGLHQSLTRRRGHLSKNLFLDTWNGRPFQFPDDSAWNSRFSPCCRVLISNMASFTLTEAGCQVPSPVPPSVKI